MDYSRICIVGNGPSAENMGKEIDSWPFVVRMKEYHVFGPRNSGKKIDALACFRGNCCPDDVDIGEFWFTVSDEFSHELCDLTFIRKRADGKPVFVITDKLYGNVRRHLTKLSKHPRAPTTGFAAIAMAIEFGAKELFLVGFDAVSPDVPGWGDAVYRSDWAAHGHDYKAEKRAINNLHHNIWLGDHSDVKLTWRRLPGARCPKQRDDNVKQDHGAT